MADDDALISFEDLERQLLHAIEVQDLEEIDRMLDLMRMAAEIEERDSVSPSSSSD